MSPFHRATRREFLHETLAAGALLAGAPALLAAQDSAATPPGKAPAPPDPSSEPPPAASAPAKKSPYADLRVAFIGTAGIGNFHLDHAEDFGLACPCYADVDTKHYERIAKMYPHAKAYQDYREMFDKEHKNIDAVMVGTPDHHHYPATMIAMKLGKHVYTQKPLTHTVWEARQLALAADKYKLATQMGNQGHAKEGWRLVYEWIRSGAIGDVKAVHNWTDRPIWPQGVERPEGDETPPSNLDWDVYCGPAPLRPFKGGTYHPFNWRGWWDFGAGALGDMACHTMDGMFWALEPGHCTSVETMACSSVNDETFPKSSIVKWEFPARELSTPQPGGGSKPWHRPAFTAYWYDGGLVAPYPSDLELPRKLPPTGNLFIGTKASIVVAGDYGDSPRIYPESRMQEIGKPAQLLERSPGHVKEWVMACVGEQPIDFPKSNFHYAAPFTETVQLGNVALRYGRKLMWDGPNLTVTNLAEANQFVTKAYREGWKF